jgi:hypothetical protein
MKNFTSSLLVNRLLISSFTLIIVLIAGKANGFNKQSNVNNPGVEYASLSASATDKTVFINWVTASEVNNNHFEVERSTDMSTFKTVAMVLDGFDATGSKGKSYKFKEAAGDLKKGRTIYYRLKQVDADNQAHYSSVMAVQLNTSVVVFPKSNQSNAKTSNTSVISIQESGYSINSTLLSKQSTSFKNKKNMSANGSYEQVAGIFNALESILGAEFYTPKLSLA